MQDVNWCYVEFIFKMAKKRADSFFQETWNFRKLPSTANMQTMCCRGTTQHLSCLPTKYLVQRNSSSKWSIIVIVRGGGQQRQRHGKDQEVEEGFSNF